MNRPVVSNAVVPFYSFVNFCTQTKWINNQDMFALISQENTDVYLLDLISLI